MTFPAQSWAFLKDGAGILPASNMADPLRGSNLGPTDLLVREAVQNSLDERRRDSDDSVRIRFERDVLIGNGKKLFVDALDLRVLADRRRAFRTAHNWFGRGNHVLDDIGKPDVPLPVLLISDFNANGLGGHWNRRRSKQDRFFNLVLSIGGSLKWEDEEEGDTDAIRTLGSYGYGKMAFALSSEIEPVLLHGHWNRRRSKQDRFFNLVLSIGGSLKWEDEEEGEHRRHTYARIVWVRQDGVRVEFGDSNRRLLLHVPSRPQHYRRPLSTRAMATAFLPQHSVGDIDYAGQAYYGNDSGEERSPRKPLVDDDAHAWVRTLGLPERSNEETGTTVVIPAFAATMNEVVESCETWWWPTMARHHSGRRVNFEFLDEGESMPGRNPRSRRELSPFIDCHKQINANTVGDKYDVKDVRVNPAGGPRKAGRLVLKAIDASSESDDHVALTNRIAFVRDGLVIKYSSEFAHEDRPPVVGVFSPDVDPDTMQAFVFSEPPTHDDWVENGDRLRGKYDWGRDFIRLTKQRLRNLTRDFQTRQMDAPAVERTNAAEFLRRTLRNLFTRRTGSRTTVKPESRSRAFTIETIDSGRTQNGNAQDAFVVFRIGLSTHAPVESVDVEVTLSLKVLADDNMRPMDVLAPHVRTATGEYRGSGPDGRTTFMSTLGRGERVDAEARAEVHPAWTTRWDIEVARCEDRAHS